MLKYPPGDVCRWWSPQVSLGTFHGTDAAPALGGITRPQGENHSEQLGHRWVGKEDCFNKLKLVKTSEISLICSTLRSKKSSPTTIPSAGAAQIGASEPSCSTEKFWRWVLPLVRFRLKNSWKSVDPAVHSEGPCACLTCPQLIQMHGSRSWIKDKTRRCDNWH